MMNAFGMEGLVPLMNLPTDLSYLAIMFLEKIIMLSKRAV